MIYFRDICTFAPKRVEELNAVADAYVTYCETYEKVKAYNDNAVNEVIEKQAAEIKAEMKTADEMKAYLEQLTVPYNVAIMAAAGAANASEANPTDVTDFIVNPEFTNAPTTGWTRETPTNNEFAFDEGIKVNAELWNKSAFTLSQTIKGLPAGTYELHAKAIYRDGRAVNQELVDKYNEVGSEEAWANHNAQLFMKTSDDNDKFTYIKAIESLKFTDNSFVSVVTSSGTEEDADGKEIYFPQAETIMNGKGVQEKENVTTTCVDESVYPFDTKMGDYYYLASMQGFLQICKQHPEAGVNKVQITIESGDDLEIGIRKTVAIGSDWVIFDSFQLFYLSGDTFKEIQTGIDDIKPVVNDGVKYNVAGQRVANSYKGIVIMNGKKQYVK